MDRDRSHRIAEDSFSSRPLYATDTRVVGGGRLDQPQNRFNFKFEIVKEFFRVDRHLACNMAPRPAALVTLALLIFSAALVLLMSKPMGSSSSSSQEPSSSMIGGLVVEVAARNLPLLQCLMVSTMGCGNPYGITSAGKSRPAPPPCRLGLAAAKQGSSVGAADPPPRGQAVGEDVSERVEIARAFVRELRQLQDPPFLDAGPDCAANFGTKVGGPVCCGQTGSVASAAFICYNEAAPHCVGFVQNRHFGRCKASDPPPRWGWGAWGPPPPPPPPPPMSLSRPWTSTCEIKVHHDRRPVLVLMEDKYQAQVYAESLGIPTIPLLAVLRHSREIPWATLPARYVIKTNHWSGKLWINVDGVDITAGGSGEDHKSRDFDCGVASREIDEIMPKPYSDSEWAAGNIADKRILIQQYVPQALDIKVFTFHGQAKYYYT